MSSAAETPLTAKQVAGELGRSLDWFYRNRKKLEASGFPKPLPVCGGWHGAAVRAWKDLTMPRTPTVTVQIAAPDPELAKRAEQIANRVH